MGYRDHHTARLFQKLSILPIDEINNEAIALFTFRYFNNTLPVTFDNFFKLNMELHSHNTRSSTKIHIDHARTNYKNYSTKFKGCDIWNNLPTAIKKTPNHFTFFKKEYCPINNS